MAKLHSEKVEKKLLALFMRSPTFMRILSTDVNIFAIKQNRELAKIIKKFVYKYRSAPSKAALISYANENIGSDKDLAQTTDAVKIISALPTCKPSEFEFYYDKANNYFIGRKIFDMGVGLTHKFKKNELNFLQIKQEMLAELLVLGSGGKDVSRRGFLHHNVKERYQQYKESRRRDARHIIPFGISALDEKTGGMQKSFVTLIYSRTGGGKTRTAINIAYNAARAGYNVIYFSLEMAFNLLASCFDSRMAAIDSKQIIFGRLSKEDRLKYKTVLKQQVKDQLGIYIVDVAMNAKSDIILEETEIYKSTTGRSPDLIVVDYAGIMLPMQPYGNLSERFNNLFQEYHQIAKYLNVGLLTAAQESRDASKADIRKEENEGVHNIGLSNFMAPHCENVLRAKQDPSDKLASIVWFIIDKCRYGATGGKVAVTARWATTYVGDRVRTDETKFQKAK
jgi:replicative DNA helicase